MTRAEIRDKLLVMKTRERTRDTRPYRMRARAEAAERRAQRVMDAAIELWRERWYDEITLEDIAERSGISLSTIMRRFGSKDGLVSAVIATDRTGSTAGRDRVATGDVDGAVRALVDDYERVGDAVIRNLALEQRVAAIGQAVKRGRAAQRAFIARVFAPWLPAEKGSAYDRRLAQFIVAGDVYTWKLFRRDHGLSKANTIYAMQDVFARLMRED